MDTRDLHDKGLKLRREMFRPRRRSSSRHECLSARSGAAADRDQRVCLWRYLEPPRAAAQTNRWRPVAIDGGDRTREASFASTSTAALTKRAAPPRRSARLLLLVALYCGIPAGETRAIALPSTCCASAGRRETRRSAKRAHGPPRSSCTGPCKEQAGNRAHARRPSFAHSC